MSFAAEQSSIPERQSMTPSNELSNQAQLPKVSRLEVKIAAQPRLMSVRPVASWMPRTSGRGMKALTALRVRVRPRTRQRMETNAPAETISPVERDDAKAAAEMAFIGWTHIYISSKR
ncbi:hypothetical protein HK097_007878 [Rhizophlyctis rosea]|uniref:Uncharacterized protein n=1 Tax=Rhizophlyctis rosea TaxID=64517 RepID=A0AAD5X7Z2_9FUNG|nr:hypothetical protein HK097_007878 [Rhizophlyctis rosea]